jgi:hypothetical protein
MPDGGPYHVNTEITLEGTFRDDTGLIDQTGPVTCKAKKPGGTLVTPAPTVSHASQGVYTAKIKPASGEGGDWKYRFDGDKAGKWKMLLVFDEWQ